MTELANIIKESTTEPTERFASLIEKRSKSLGSVGLAVVYTVGHIIIAIACATFIFDAPLNLAAIDAFIEPIMNGFWFYLLHHYFKTKLSDILLTIIYTIGHIGVATLCAAVIFNAPLKLAAIDAFVEPIINAFWFYLLHSYWKKNNV
tara:strand:+ start:11345 stop:11788 length:444 start_codon:yes stop_codon:yes gene_type:complete